MVVQGHAYDHANAPLPIATPIRVFLDGVDYSNDSRVLDAAGTYSVMIAGNWMLNQTTQETPTIKEGPNLGEAVQFAAGNFTSATGVFQETLTWSPGATITQNLHLGSTATTPDPLKIQGIVSQPARGGNQYAFLCNPTPSNVSLYDYFFEVDRPRTYHGDSFSLSGVIPKRSVLRENLSSASFLNATGDALKLVYRNPGGASASSQGQDIVVDRLEFNATTGGTLDWEPGNTIMGDAPAPGPGQILGRSPSCGDTNTPADFHLANEPGVPLSTNVSLRILAPAAGQTLTGGQSFTIQWSMSDDVFLTRYLRVWVNVTYGNVSYSLLAGASGVTSVAWTVPDVTDPAASVHVDAVDPYGARTSRTTAFMIQKSTPFAVLIAILIAVVIVAFILFAWWSARRKAREPPKVPPSSPRPATPTAPAQAATPATQPWSPATKVCPRCGKEVQAENDSCFFCGHLFVKPPT